ncbi:hypothetical protein PI125_g22552 [Phytophthora idaei]|nr:hypothetical protein PI125_g22552 [Phytophthora idaei]
MVSRLRVRLDNRFGHWNAGSFNPDTFAGDVNALVNMLATNRYLEYFEIYVPTAKHDEVIDQFREYHLKPIAKSSNLPLEIKVRFLSVMSARTPTAKKTRNSSLLLGAGGCEVNSRIGSTMFSLQLLLFFGRSTIAQKVTCGVFPGFSEFQKESLAICACEDNTKGVLHAGRVFDNLFVGLQSA